MEKREYASEAEAMAVAKRALYLAWQAAGGSMGRGVFQDRGEQGEEAVWDHAYNERDYSSGRHERGGRINADYVFGRMLKLRFEVTGKEIQFDDYAPRGDYQSWCGKYRTFASLFDAAAKEIAPTEKAAA